MCFFGDDETPLLAELVGGGCADKGEAWAERV